MIFAALLLSLAAPAAVDAAPAPSKHVEELLRQTDGATQERAFKVGNVREEYQIVRALGLQPKIQSLVMVHGRAYDVLTDGGDVIVNASDSASIGVTSIAATLSVGVGTTGIAVAGGASESTRGAATHARRFVFIGIRRFRHRFRAQLPG